MRTRQCRRRLGREHEIAVEVDARRALERIERGEEHSDLILCDLRVPPMTGMVFYEALRGRRPSEPARVTSPTGGAATECARASLDRTAGRAIDRPVDSRTLRSPVRCHAPAGARRGDAP